jgi:hypothetical protein
LASPKSLLIARTGHSNPIGGAPFDCAIRLAH